MKPTGINYFAAKNSVPTCCDLNLFLFSQFWYMHKPPSPPPLAVGRGMVGAVPGASAAPHLVPSNKLRLASNGELDLADVNLADMDPEVIRVSSTFTPIARKEHVLFCYNCFCSWAEAIAVVFL